MIMRSVGALSLSLLAIASHADEKTDLAYQAFLQARGEAAWINAAADHSMANTAFRPIPPLETFPSDPAKQALGFELFHDPRLSRDGTVTCTSCHMGMRGGTDNLPVSRGIGGALGKRNAPTVFNSAFNFRQFWDGRAFNLDTQSLGPITDPAEMGHDLEAVIQELADEPHYAEQFAAIYPDGLTAANLGNAIAQHTRDMTRTDSRFNQHLTSGVVATLSEQELRGWKRFNDVGCTSCHNGINLGGNSYQKLGSVAAFANTGMIDSADDGLYLRTGRNQDRQVFKVPSLHNVALTAPYFHDGSVATLDEAVRQMGKLHAGRSLSDADIGDIVGFLGSLSSQFFSGMAPRMSSMEIQGEMRHQMQQMNHSQHQDHHMNHSQHGATTDQASHGSH